MIFTVKSKLEVPIRLTEECWKHIRKEHAELIGCLKLIKRTLNKPDMVFLGNHKYEFIGVLEALPDKYVAVVYREEDMDGFVITAFFTRRIRKLKRKTQIWPSF